MPIPVYISLHYSDDDQGGGSTLERQRAVCEAFVAEIDGRVVDVMVDAGVSARDGHNLRHGKLANFNTEALARRVPKPCILMFEEPDRFSRAASEEQMHFLTGLLRAGVSVAFARQKLVLRPGADNLVGLLTTLISGDGANKENTKRIGRVQDECDIRRSKLRKGFVYSARVPHWLICPRVAGKGQFEREITKHPMRCEAVVEMFDLAARGMGNILIAARLNGLRGTQPRYEPFNGREWTHDVVDSVLSNPAVRGWFRPHSRVKDIEKPIGRTGKPRYKRVPGETIIKDYFPQIIGDDLWDRAQTARARNARAKRGRPSERHTNLFSGILRCGFCNKTLYLSGRSARGAGYLKCRSAAQGGCVHDTGYCTADIDDAVLLRLSDPLIAGPSDFYSGASAQADRMAAEAERLTLAVAEETRLYKNARRNANNADDEKEAEEFRADMRGHKAALQAAETALAEAERALTAARGSDPLTAAREMVRLVSGRKDPAVRAELALLARRLFSRMTMLHGILTLHCGVGAGTVTLAVPSVRPRGRRRGADLPPGVSMPTQKGDWARASVQACGDTEAAQRCLRDLEAMEEDRRRQVAEWRNDPANQGKAAAMLLDFFRPPGAAQ
jgi:hypothetical protein